MNQQFINTIILSSAFLSLFGISELLHHAFHVKAEYTRKLVHFGTGLLTFLFPVMLKSHWWVLILCSIFFVMLIITKKTQLLKSIHGVGRKTHGSYLYPVSVYGCYLLGVVYNNMIFFYLPILILAISDPIAALSGTKWGKTNGRSAKKKTLFGSVMFFISALLACVIIYYNMPVQSGLLILATGIVIGLAGAIVESYSYKGWDNFTIPLVVAAILVMFRNFIL